METKKVKTQQAKGRIEQLQLFPATAEDFYYWEWGEKKRMIGKQYFLENQDGTIGLYEIGKHTVPEELKQFIDEGRCFVLRSDSVLRVKEERLRIKEELKMDNEQLIK